MECPCLLGPGAGRPLVCPLLCPHVQQCPGLSASTAAALWRGHSATRSVSPDVASMHILPPAPPQVQAPLYYSQRVGCYTAVGQPAGNREGQLGLQLMPVTTQAGLHAQPYTVQTATRTSCPTGSLR